MTDRWANYPYEEKKRSEAFIKTLNIGDRLWPKGWHSPLTVSGFQRNDTIVFEESMWPMVYPQRERFHSNLGFYWLENIKPRMDAILEKAKTQ